MTRFKRLGLHIVVLFVSANLPLASPVNPASLVNQNSNPMDFALPQGYGAQKIYTPPIEFPHSVAISPDDIIVLTDNVGDGIIQVHENGTLSTYASPSSLPHEGVAFDSSGNLFVVDEAGVLWKFSTEGITTQVANGVHHGGQLDIAPSGAIFIVGGRSSDVQRVTPNGQVSVYASGFTGADDVAVSPITGEVYVSDWSGAIFKANTDGSVSLLTGGLTPQNNNIAFANDGTLYHMNDSNGLSIISTLDGSRTEISWMWEKTACFVPKNIAVDSQGRVVALDPTFNHVVRFDMDTEKVDVLWHGVGNSRALAVSPDGDGIYIGTCQPSSEDDGRLVRIEPNGIMTTIVDGLLPYVSGVAFDTTGLIYISAYQPSFFETIIYTATVGGITGTLTTLPFYVNSLAVDPTTGYLWGDAHQELWFLDDAGMRHTIPFSISTGVDVDLAFMPDGVMYVHTNTSDTLIAPVERGVYHVDPTGPTYTLIADLTTVNVCCTQGSIGLGLDGNIYWIGFGDRHTPGNEADMHMLRILTSGETTLFAKNLPIDPAAIAGDPTSSDLYFSSAGGVYRIFEVKHTYIPITLKGSE